MPTDNSPSIDTIARRLAEYLTTESPPPKVTTVEQVNAMSAADVMKAHRAGRIDHDALAADSRRIEAERLDRVRTAYYGAIPQAKETPNV